MNIDQNEQPQIDTSTLDDELRELLEDESLVRVPVVKPPEHLTLERSLDDEAAVETSFQPIPLRWLV